MLWLITTKILMNYVSLSLSIIREGLKKSDFYHLGGGVNRGQLSLFIFFPNVLKTIKCVAADITRGVADISGDGAKISRGEENILDFSK